MNFTQEKYHSKLIEPFNYYFDIKNACQLLVNLPGTCSPSENQGMREFLDNFDKSQEHFAEFLGRTFGEDPAIVYERHKNSDLYEENNPSPKLEFEVDEVAAKLYLDAYEAILDQTEKLLLSLSITEQEIEKIKTTKSDKLSDIINDYYNRTQNVNYTSILSTAATVIRMGSGAINTLKDLLGLKQQMGMTMDRFVEVFSNFIISTDKIIGSFAENIELNLGYHLEDEEEMKSHVLTRNFGALTYYNDYKEASIALRDLITFFASVMGMTFDEMLDILNNENKEALLAKGNFVQFELTDEETIWTPTYVYEKLFDAWTYIRHIYETYDKFGLPIMKLLTAYADISLPVKEFYYGKIVEQLPTDEEKYVKAGDFLKKMAVHTYWTEQALDIMDIVYGFEHGTIFKSVGSYKSKILPKIKNVKFTVVK